MADSVPEGTQEGEQDDLLTKVGPACGFSLCWGAAASPCFVPLLPAYTDRRSIRSVVVAPAVYICA